MNTTQNRLTSVIVLLILTVSQLTFSQNTYLKITLSDAQNDFVSYPPGTKFELFNSENDLVYSEKDTTKTFKIEGKYRLVVNPPYTNTAKTYNLYKGKVEQADNSKYFIALSKTANTSKTHDNSNVSRFSERLTMKKTLQRSDINPKKYNATFEFSNGIIASFMDGEMLASLNGKLLTIEGRYLIYSEYGLIKLSFRPSNGETWWVFEPIE